MFLSVHVHPEKREAAQFSHKNFKVFFTVVIKSFRLCWLKQTKSPVFKEKIEASRQRYGASPFLFCHESLMI
jgi:hypothetical protein